MPSGWDHLGDTRIQQERDAARREAEIKPPTNYGTTYGGGGNRFVDTSPGPLDGCCEAIGNGIGSILGKCYDGIGFLLRKTAEGAVYLASRAYDTIDHKVHAEHYRRQEEDQRFNKSEKENRRKVQQELTRADDASKRKYLLKDCFKIDQIREQIKKYEEKSDYNNELTML